MANDLDVLFSDVTERYNKPIPEESVAWVTNVIDQAVRELLNQVPTIPARIASGALDPEFVADKVVAAVLRVVRNPEGMVQEAEGDYSYRLNNLVASGDIWFPEKDLLKLGWINTARNRPRTVYSTPSRGFGFPS